MTIHKKFVDQIIKRKEGNLDDLLGKNGLDISSQAKTAEDLIDPLDQIIYTVEFLKEAGLIEFHADRNIHSTLFDKQFGDETKIDALLYVHNWWKIAAGWKIEIKPGLIHYRQQGYQTDAQLKEKKQFRLTIEAALLASAATAILTAILAKPQIINYYRLFK